MSRISEDMTLADVGRLPGLEPLSDYLMECRATSRDHIYSTPLGSLRAWQGDAIVDAVMTGLRRLDEVVQARPDTVIDIWSDSEKTEVAGRARTKLVFFPGNIEAPFVMVTPGGGYNAVCSYLEGYPAAARLNELGYNAFVLSYRTREDASFPAPLEDLARALHYVLDHARELGTSRRYALMGFSAGAHLAGTMATDAHGWHRWDLPRPDAMVLCYPALDLRTLAVTDADPIATEMLFSMLGSDPTPDELASWSVNVGAGPGFPPTYLWQCEDDDTVPYENLRLMDAKLSELDVPHEAITYARGGHGLVKPHDIVADTWMDGVLAFLGRWL